MEDLTTGSINRHLLRTTSFMLVTMVFQTLLLSGRISTSWAVSAREAIAGVGIAGNLTFVVLAITQMLAVGTTTLISHAAGRKEREHAQLVLTQSLLLAAFIGVVFLIVVTALRDSYVNTLSPDPVSGTRAIEYLSWFIPAMALQFPMVVMGAALRGTGNFRPGMIVQTATVLINILLAPALMFGWLTGSPMGVAGAGLASLVAITVGTIWLAIFFFEVNSYLKLHIQLTPHGDMWGRILKIGLPAGVEFGLVAVYLFLVYTISRPFGAAAQAGFGDRPADRSGELHAGRRARLRRRSGRRTEFRGAQSGAGARDVPESRADGGLPANAGHAGVSDRARGDDPVLFRRSDRHCRRSRVPRDHFLEPGRVRHHLRKRQHVPGNGQYDSTAHRIHHAHHHRRNSGGAARPEGGIRAAMDLVALRRATLLQLSMNVTLLMREFRAKLRFA
jgi:hypothetical protein